MYKVKSANLSVDSEVDTSHLRPIRPSPDNEILIIPVGQEIHNAVRITINSPEVYAWMDRYTINGDFISDNCCINNKIATEDMSVKPQETGIEGSGSTMTKKATMEFNISGHEISRICNISNVKDRDAMLK